jgi:excisionase family DNA binding protein
MANAIKPELTIKHRLLTIQQAAEYLNSSRRFIRSLGWSGKFPYVRFGKRILFDRNDLDNFIESQKSTAA